MRKKINSLLPAVGLYCFVILVVFGRALVPGPTEMIWGDDIHRQYYFYRKFFNSFLKEGIWPWWNPYIFSGAPFMANAVVNIWYPPTWLFFFLPVNLAYSWHVALHIVWAMLGMYVLIHTINNSPQPTLNPSSPPLNVRGGRVGLLSWGKGELRAVSMLPAWTAGLIFGLSGFFMARIWAGHVDVIAAASWMPWVFGAFWHLNHDRWKNLRHGGEISTSLNRRIVVAGGVFAMQILAGYQTMAFFTVLAVGIASACQCVYERSVKPLFIAGLAGFLGIGLAAIQIIPAQEFFRASIRTFTLPYSWNSYGSLTIESLKQFFNPFMFGDQLTYSGPPPNFAEHAFFIGRVGLLAVLGGVVIATGDMLLQKRSSKFNPRPWVKNTPLAGGIFILWFWFFAVIALFGLWVSLGPNAPIDLQYILWKTVPMYQYLRIPARHLILVVFGLSGMVGLAIYAIRSMHLRLVFVGLITIEMILFARHFIALKPIPESRHDRELINILSPHRCRSFSTPEVECLYRVLPNFGVWVEPRDSLDFDAVMPYRIFSATGYDPSILRSYYEYIDLANGNAPGSSILTHDVQVPYLNLFSQAMGAFQNNLYSISSKDYLGTSPMDFLNIKYILVPRAYDPLYGVKTDRFVLLREDVTRDYRLYENKSVKPRFFFENGTVIVKKYTPNEIVLSTDNNIGETLFSSEVFYPGWEGFIDGKKVDVIKTNHAFRALFVPAGRHTVIYRYSPRIFLIGGLLTALTALACIGILFKKQ